MPVTTAMSATLKIAGKPQTWMKSMTWPMPNAGLAEQPVGHVAEGAAENEPERDRPGDATGCGGANQMMNPMTPIATSESTQVKPLASENAAPGVRDEMQLEDLTEHRDRRRRSRGSR